jgi:hydrogenase nickel insertion protein HypA
MHETMVAESIIETITEKAAELGLKKPLKVTISCGKFNAVNDEVMQFAFETIAENTICKGMQLEIIHKPLICTCKACGKKFEFDIYKPACPACKSEDFQIGKDQELIIENIEFQDPSK